MREGTPSPWAAALSSVWAGGWLGGGRWRMGGARAIAAPSPMQPRENGPQLALNAWEGSLLLELPSF